MDCSPPSQATPPQCDVPTWVREATICQDQGPGAVAHPRTDCEAASRRRRRCGLRPRLPPADAGHVGVASGARRSPHGTGSGGPAERHFLARSGAALGWAGAHTPGRPEEAVAAGGSCQCCHGHECVWWMGSGCGEAMQGSRCSLEHLGQERRHSRGLSVRGVECPNTTVHRGSWRSTPIDGEKGCCCTGVAITVVEAFCEQATKLPARCCPCGGGQRAAAA
mmetsp:Transcript_39908/g.104613  ORF Transcript_39908/g.104613 Transcript_39908/m.104613 type:complete len:222 (-) Transcript_39908:1575-2240(-)